MRSQRNSLKNSSDVVDIGFVMDYKQYENPEELRKLQIISTKVLEVLDHVRQLLKIPYFIYAGTAIGALRHGGFIPWDDGIDVGFFRVSSKCIHEKWEHYATLAQGGESPLYADFTDRHPFDRTVTNAEGFSLKRIAFGDIEVNIPNDCDALLRRGCGDYMAAPPEKDRKNYCPSKLDVGEC